MAYQTTPFTGRYCAFKVNGATIRGVGSWRIAITTASIDASDFTTVWKKNLTGSVGWSGSVAGYFDGATDSTGMLLTLMKKGLQGDKIADIRFYLNTATSYFFMPQNTTEGASTASTDAGAYIGNMSLEAGKDDIVRSTFDIQGYGPIALFGSSTGLIIMEAT
jgi:hypothetical protein